MIKIMHCLKKKNKKKRLGSYVPLCFPRGSSYFTPTQQPGLKSAVPAINVTTLLFYTKSSWLTTQAKLNLNNSIQIRIKCEIFYRPLNLYGHKQVPKRCREKKTHQHKKLFSTNYFWSPKTQQYCQKYPILIDIDTEYICNSEFLESMQQH